MVLSLLLKKKPEEFIRHYIEKKKTSINRTTGLQIDKGTVYNHNNALKRLLQYCTDRKKNLKWELFDKFFEDDFEEWFVIEKDMQLIRLLLNFQS